MLTNALQPFLALTKSATSPRAAADLIARATSAPNTYIFAELLATPQIQALSTCDDPAFASSLTLLQIFSYGTYADYRSATTGSLPTLNDEQITKLRQLSLVSLAQDPANLAYARLLPALGLETAAELENLVVSAIYAGLVYGTLDPYNQVVNLTSVAPLRDMPPNSIPDLLTTLHTWAARCTSTLSELEAQIASIRNSAKTAALEEKEWKEYVDKLHETKGNEGGDKTGRSWGTSTRSQGGEWKSGAGKRGISVSPVEDSDAMVLDDTEEENEDRRGSSSKPNKKRGGGLFISK